MTLTTEQIQLVRMLCDIAGKLPQPEGYQVDVLLHDIETFLFKQNEAEYEN